MAGTTATAETEGLFKDTLKRLQKEECPARYIISECVDMKTCTESVSCFTA